MDLEFFDTDSELQKKLDYAATVAIEKAFAEFKGSDIAESIEARLAVPADELEIRKLFDRYPMRMPGFDLIYDRSPDFFSLLRARGVASVALTGGLKGTAELMGLGSLSIRDGFLNGKKARVGYLGDLRIVPHRKTFRLWRAMYGRLIEEVAKELNVESFLTAILGDNALALRSLVERRNSDFLYESVGQMRMLNIFSGLAPLSFARSDRALRGEVVSDDEFAAFYEKEAPRLRHGLTSVPKSGTAILVRNEMGSVLLGARFVSPDRAKRMRVANADFQMRLLLKGINLAKDGSLSTGYLSSVTFAQQALAADRRMAMSEMISTVYREPFLRASMKAKSMLVIPDAVGLSLRELGGRLHQSTQVELFEVRPKSVHSSALDTSGLSAGVQSVSFDMALV